MHFGEQTLFFLNRVSERSLISGLDQEWDHLPTVRLSLFSATLSILRLDFYFAELPPRKSLTHLFCYSFCVIGRWVIIIILLLCRVTPTPKISETHDASSFMVWVSFGVYIKQR